MQFFQKIKALGSDIELWLNSEDSKDFESDFLEIEATISNFERSFSRFMASSELSRLNKHDGDFEASPELIEILKIAKEYHRITKGIFDPSVLKTLESIGYKSSFDKMSFKPDNSKPSKDKDVSKFTNLIINESKNSVYIPEDLKIDLGGIGKGYIVDKIARLLKEKNYHDFWISAGGDMFVSGLTAQRQAHKIGIQNPQKPDQELFDIQKPEESLAIATSGITKRHWQYNGKNYHHLIDPRTNTSVNNELLAVTILAKNVSDADVFAKTVFILGKSAGIDFIKQRPDIEGIIIDQNLRILMSDNMNKYLIDRYE